MSRIVKVSHLCNSFGLVTDNSKSGESQMVTEYINDPSMPLPILIHSFLTQIRIQCHRHSPGIRISVDYGLGLWQKKIIIIK